MNILLKEDEIKQALKEANDKAQDYGDDLQPLPERNVARKQIKKIVDEAKRRGVFSVDTDGLVDYVNGNITGMKFWAELLKVLEKGE
jgi:hypothetical protein